MPSNFDFLTPAWQAVRADALDAERLADVEPRASVFHARRALESAVRHVYAVDRSLDVAEARTDGLNDLMNAQGFRNALPPRLYDEAHKLRKLDNDAVHESTPINPWTARVATKMLHTLLAWAHPVYTPGASGATPAACGEALLPTPTDAKAIEREATAARKRVAELEQQTAADRQTIGQIQTELAAAHSGKSQAEQTADQQRAELAALQAEIGRVKAERRAEADRVADATANADEATTRTALIDVSLARAGWDLKDARQVRREVELGAAGRADYVLYGADGRPLAVVEAKKASRDPEDGRTQAARYADELERRHGRRPIVYWTNGYQTWLHDDRAFGADGYPPRRVQDVAGRNGLETMIHRRDARRDLTGADVRLDRAICDRYYQEEAAKRVFAAFQGRRRKALLVMATGTGKTRTTVGFVDVLMRRGWVGRTLFLADRKSLVRQARKAFDKHLPTISTCNLLDEADVGQRVVFSTYPTMNNALGAGRYGVDAFDLVVVDEAHRSVYQRYRHMLVYFDALLLGLTATPRSQVDRDTYGLFELEAGLPTYAYELDQAVADEYLVPPRAASVPVRFLREGVKYKELSDAERAEYEQKLADPETGEVPDAVEPAELNTFLFNNDTVDKVLAHLMAHGHKVAGGDRLAKTIVFAKSIPHARFIRERFDQQYPHLGGEFLRVIVNGDTAAESMIEKFQETPEPTIAVSVDMLDTGVDVPEVANLVFFKLVRSQVKFWQMIGRGTRLRPDLCGPGADKKDFRVFDFCQNLEFFEANPKGHEATAQRPLSAHVFDARLDVARAIAALPDAERAAMEPLRKECLDAACLTVSRMNRENYLVRPHLERVERLASREAWETLDEIEEQAARADLALLPTEAGAGEDPRTRGVDLLMARLELALITRDGKQEKLIKRVRELAERLAGKRGIPAIAQNAALLAELQSDEWWEATTPLKVEQARLILRDLARFASNAANEQVVNTTTLIDELGASREQDLIVANPSLAGYRRRVEKFLRNHREHPTIHRLMMNEPITAADVSALETILFAADGVGGTREQFAREYGEQPLGLLVRQVCGLERNAAKAAFADFLGRVSLTADQIRFVDEIINRVVNNGFMDKAELRERPFVDLHEQSILGVFPGGDDAQAIVDRVDQIKLRAVPATAV